MLALSLNGESTAAQHYCSMADSTAATLIPYNEPINNEKVVKKCRERDSLVKSIESKLNNEESDYTNILKLIEALIEDDIKEQKSNLYGKIVQIAPFHMKVLLFLEEQTGMYIINTVGGYKLPVFKKKQSNALEKQKNSRFGLTVLGKAYESGKIGLTKNSRAAVYAYKYASIEKCPSGSFQYARCLENGIGTEINLEKACNFYRISYKLGYIPGIYRYALMCLKGNDFIDRDIQYGLHLLNLSVTLSDGKYLEPFYALGAAYRSKSRDVVADYCHSFRIFLKGATLGCSNCQYQVSEDYERGDCVGMDIDKAFMWCKEAAEQEHIQAQYKLACMMMQLHFLATSGEGDVIPRNIIASAEIDIGKIGGVKSDKVELVKREIIEQEDFYGGNKLKELNIGKFYRNSVNIKEVAIKMAKEAASSGHVGAVMLLAKAMERTTASDRDLLLALWYYKIAVSLGSKEASYKVASLEMSLWGQGKTFKPSKSGLSSFFFW
ncbi:uncharacterized protein PAEPH01_0215 [Pancytospora epiphaga]|nr:uncharacterized protein PAEPH01_0215 [Pancytospora epiphaga]